MIQEILKKCPQLSVSPEHAPHKYSYTMITSGAVEVEVGEFIYALVSMVKPEYILETGTHFGVSSSFMGLALKKNGHGKLTTIDIFAHPQAKQMWDQLKLNDVIEFVQGESLKYTLEQDVDILFLDSEPHLRYQEFVRFYDRLVPGGLILVHDLHEHLSYHPKTECFPFGDFRELLGPYIKEHKVQTMSFPTPRGLRCFKRNVLTFRSPSI